jgi:hypothetical protein
MILYNSKQLTKRKERSSRAIDVDLSIMPEKPEYIIRSDRDRTKFIKSCEGTIRKSMEYKQYIQFLKDNMEYDRCIVLKGITREYGKKYSIEVHHTPFTLYSIVDTVIRKREELGESLDPLDIADEVCELHYTEKVGLIPLSATMHELVHSDRVFIPLNLIYQDYVEFFNEYEKYMDGKLLDKIETLVDMSLKCPSLQSNILNPEFTYVNMQGFSFPEVPEEWKTLFKEAS